MIFTALPDPVPTLKKKNSCQWSGTRSATMQQFKPGKVKERGSVPHAERSTGR